MYQKRRAVFELNYTLIVDQSKMMQLRGLPKELYRKSEMKEMCQVVPPIEFKVSE